MPDDTQTEFCWLVEEFAPNGNSTGRYMLDMGSLAITHDVYAARRLRREQSAGFRALDMKERHGGDWRPVEHGFEPAPAAQPAPEACQPNGLMFDAYGEPRTRYVRVTLNGTHCVMHPSEGDCYVQDARNAGDPDWERYIVRDVYLSEREFEDLGEFNGW